MNPLFLIMLRSIASKRLQYFKYNYSTSSNGNINTSLNDRNDMNVSPNPPSFFHNESNLPKKINDLVGKDNIEDMGKKNEVENKFTASIQPPKPHFDLLGSPAPQLAIPPPVFTNLDSSQMKSGDSRILSKTPGSSSTDTQNYFQSYKDFCMGMAYLGVGTAVIYFMFDQHERLDVSERQMQMMKKKQKDLVVQVQTYKNKLNKIAVENAKKNIVLQGKMQMHIALLRQQLREMGVEPVDIDKAIEQFEQDVKVDIAANSVELWVPGESALKRMIPDPHEYSKRK